MDNGLIGFHTFYFIYRVIEKLDIGSSHHCGIFHENFIKMITTKQTKEQGRLISTLHLFFMFLYFKSFVYVRR